MDKELREIIIKEARDKVVSSFSVYLVPYVFQEVILEAFDAQDWDIIQMDGCTATADYWPNKFSPVCTPHDYHFRSGRGGRVSNIIFYELCKMYALPPGQSKRRFYATQFFWAAWFKWVHLIKFNVKPLTPKMLAAYDYYKKNGSFKAYRN